MNKLFTIFLVYLFIIIGLQNAYAQHYKELRLDYSQRWKPQQDIVIKSDIDGFVFDIWWTDDKRKKALEINDTILEKSDSIKREHPNMISYLKIDIPGYNSSPVYVQGKLIETKFGARFGQDPLKANIIVDKFLFDINFLNVNSDKIITCTIVRTPEKELRDVIDFTYKILRIRSEPEGAEIFFNSTKTNRITPAEFRGLNDESIKIQLQKSGYESKSLVVVLSKNETDSLIKLKRNQMVFTDTVVVHTEPQNSDIFINDDFEGTTPDTLFGLNDTTFLKLVQKGYKDTTLTVRSKPDSMIRILVKMEKKKLLDNHPWVFYSLSGLGVVSSIVYFVYQHKNPEKFGPAPDLADPPGWPQ